QRHRTQGANRDAAAERFAELLRENLREEPPRKKTRPSRAAKARRLEEKRRQSRRKRERSARIPTD
ncbi:MAG TPA: aminoacyl-tRNA hydrolase, partial [Thermoanaerobaculia bacterium]